MSEPSHINAISAIDGRYRSKVEPLAGICSELGLMKFRTQVECRWVQFLSDLSGVPELQSLSPEDRVFIDEVAKKFDNAAAQRIKHFEATTNHDVKAVEYYVKERFSERASLQPISEWIHFACTSEDINNTAYGLMIKTAINAVLLPQMDKLIGAIDDLAVSQAETPMLSRTHGQTASPTTLGKEMKNVVVRLQRQRKQFAAVEILGKFNGAVGNFNAHLTAYPNVDWSAVSGDFVSSLGLTNNPWTTQIGPTTTSLSCFTASCVLIRYCWILTVTYGPIFPTITSNSEKLKAKPDPRRCPIKSTQSTLKTPRVMSAWRMPCSHIWLTNCPFHAGSAIYRTPPFCAISALA